MVLKLTVVQESLAYQIGVVKVLYDFVEHGSGGQLALGTNTIKCFYSHPSNIYASVYGRETSPNSATSFSFNK